MLHTEHRIHIVIAAKQFIYRLGIKTILSVLGNKSELFEIDTFDKLEKSVKRNPSPRFIILCEDIIPQPKHLFLNKIINHCSDGKVLVLGDEIIGDCHNCHYILNKDKQIDMIELLQDFFYEPPVSSYGYSDKASLSSREVDVLKLVAQGYSNKGIAEGLYISTNTVITHRKNITEKLGIKTIAGLTVYAMLNSLITPENVKY